MIKIASLWRRPYQDTIQIQNTTYDTFILRPLVAMSNQSASAEFPEIILLHGPSSVGKSSIARELQARLENPFLRLDIDDFVAMFPARYRDSGERAHEGIHHVTAGPGEGRGGLELGPRGQTFLSGFHRSVAAFAAAGNRLIVAHLFLHKEWVEECAGLLRGRTVLFVGLVCPLSVLEARERRRGGRTPGFVRGHYRQACRLDEVDLKLETDRVSPTACAERILAHLRQGRRPHALQAFTRPNPDDRKA